MAGVRGLWYTLAKLMEDYNAVKKRKVGNELAAGWQERPPARRCGSCSNNRDHLNTAHHPASTSLGLPHNQMLQSSGRNWLLLDYCSENLIVKNI